MKSWIRKPLVALIAFILSAVLILSIPFVNVWMKNKDKKEEKPKTTAINIKQIKKEKQEKKKQRPKKRPKRSRPQQRNIKSGPRFAMDLGVAGTGGVSVDPEAFGARGAGMGNDMGDVDDLPELKGSFRFSAPDAVRKKEKDAYVLLEFCVDVTGRPYNVKAVEEKPVGLGMAQAGINEINAARFQAARKDGQAVAFCVLQQPFEIKWSD